MPMNLTVASGRYSFQSEAETLIAADVSAKLGLQPHHSLLEIGCGPCLVLKDLAPLVRRCVGVDFQSQIELASVSANCELIGGRFEEIELDESFDRILIYSVIHVLPSFEDAQQFVAKAVGLLTPDGLLLVGDIPNSDLKAQFIASDFGKRFVVDWSRNLEHAQEPVPLPNAICSFTQSQIERLSHNVTRLKQPPNLPFGYTREDVLISN